MCSKYKKNIEKIVIVRGISRKTADFTESRTFRDLRHDREIAKQVGLTNIKAIKRCDFHRLLVKRLPYIGACCNTATSTTNQAPCLSVGFRSPPAPAPPLYDGSSVFQQLARCGMPRFSGPPDTMASAAGKPATTHQFAHDLLTLHRLYTPPQSAADHFKPPFFPGASALSLVQVRISISKPTSML